MKDRQDFVFALKKAINEDHFCELSECIICEAKDNGFVFLAAYKNIALGDDLCFETPSTKNIFSQIESSIGKHELAKIINAQEKMFTLNKSRKSQNGD